MNAITDLGDLVATNDDAAVLVLDADPATLALIEEWLTEAGYRLVTRTKGRIALAIVDLPHPREGGREVLQRIARRYPGTPILLLSSAFFASVQRSGGLARAFGVAGILPKPIDREAMMTAVREIAPLAG